MPPSVQVVKSLQNLAPPESKIDWARLKDFLEEKLPLSYKDWALTSAWAEELPAIIGPTSSPDFQRVFERVLKDGNWDAAAHYAASRTTPPWVVLVTGLNGIRKTTSMQQPWFSAVLAEALGGAPDSNDFPTGQNSFFRQLDYIVATIANEDFKDLYIKADKISTSEYSSEKDGVFKRYRTFAECCGVMLVRSAQKERLNILVETSGRDVASFDYVDALFPHDSGYQKLALHFTINDIQYAERSVDTRMALEMTTGERVVASGAKAAEIVAVNAGGPYGSEILKAVQSDSTRVWAGIVEDADGRRKDWHKASIKIEASDDASAWSAYAVRPDGTDSTTRHIFRR
jgi:hypothetical protein